MLRWLSLCAIVGGVLFWAGCPSSYGQIRTPHIISGSFDLAIPADKTKTLGRMVDAVLEVDHHFWISDLNVTINIEHTRVFDLTIFLESPDGTRICLAAYNPYTEYFDGADYLHTTFDDEASVYLKTATAPFTGYFKPQRSNSLSVFDGSDAFGLWRLLVLDRYAYDSGRLTELTLAFTNPEPATLSLLFFGAVLFRRRRHRQF